MYTVQKDVFDSAVTGMTLSERKLTVFQYFQNSSSIPSGKFRYEHSCLYRSDLKVRILMPDASKRATSCYFENI